MAKEDADILSKIGLFENPRAQNSPKNPAIVQEINRLKMNIDVKEMARQMDEKIKVIAEEIERDKDIIKKRQNKFQRIITDIDDAIQGEINKEKDMKRRAELEKQTHDLQHKLANLRNEIAKNTLLLTQHKLALEMLFEGTESGNVNQIQVALEKGIFIDAPNAVGTTALHQAVMLEQLHVTKFLILRGANVNARDIFGRTILHIACENDSVDLFEYLLSINGICNVKTNDGFFLLDLAGKAIKNRFQSLHLKLPYAPTNEDLINKLMSGVECQTIEGLTDIKSAIKEGIFIDTKNEMGWTGLHFASSLANVYAMKFLIAHGADVNTRDNASSTPLHEAAITGSVDAVALLLMSGADPNAETNGITPDIIALNNDIKKLIQDQRNSYISRLNGNNSFESGQKEKNNLENHGYHYHKKGM